MTRQMRSKAGDERGSAMVETALTIPLLLLLSVSVYEFGRAFQYWQVLTNAAREGARIAVLPGTTDEAIEARVQSYIKSGRLILPDDLGVDIVHDDEISIGPDADDTATASTVSVNYPFEFMVLQPVMQLVSGGSDVGAPIMMSVSATMRNE